MDYSESIELGLASSKPHIEIARKLFLTLPTKELVGSEETQYEILNEISEFFSIPIMSVQVVGSAKTGYSYCKNRKFIASESDLDIAIIDTGLFAKYTELVFKETKGYSKRTNFPIKKERSVFEEYKAYVCKGMFRPDLMPYGENRASWLNFFGRLSAKYSDQFKSINAGIYLSQCFFEYKQKSAITDYIKNKVTEND